MGLGTYGLLLNARSNVFHPMATRGLFVRMLQYCIPSKISITSKYDSSVIVK